MNGLSLMIYLAEVVGNLKFVAGACALISGIGLAGGVLFLAIDGVIVDESKGKWLPLAKKAWIPIAFAIVAALSPSTSTVYMIAASEAGEAVVTSPEAKEMLGDLKEIIRRKLKEQLDSTDV
jgi:hypothetical protein